MVGVSACIITKNEEANIGQCIENILPVAGQVVVVDTGSTDTTTHIAKKMGADVFQIPFSGNLAEARNYSLKKAVNDWILIIDADERIAKEDYKDIKAIVSKPEVEGYRILIRNYTADSSVEGWRPNDRAYQDYANLPGFYLFNLVRLFRKSAGIRYEAFVHETNEKSLKGKKILQSSVVIHHLGRIDKTSTAQKDTLYLELGHRKLQQNPGDPRAYYELAKQYMAFGKFEQALELLKTATNLNPNDIDILFQYALCFHRLGRQRDAHRFYKRTLSLAPHHFGALVNLGSLMQDMGNFEESERCLTEAQKQAPYHPAPYYHLGVLKMKKRHLAEAIHLFYMAVEKNPNNLSPLPQIAKCYMKMGSFAKAKEVLNLIKRGMA